MENRLYAFDWKYIGDMELVHIGPLNMEDADIHLFKGGLYLSDEIAE